MAVSATKNLVIDQGATFEVSIRYLDSNRVPVDLNGSVATMIISRRNKPAEVIAQPACEVRDEGIIICSLTDEQTALLAKGTYDYVINYENVLAQIHRLFRGQVEVRY